MGNAASTIQMYICGIDGELLDKLDNDAMMFLESVFSRPSALEDRQSALSRLDLKYDESTYQLKLSRCGDGRLYETLKVSAALIFYYHFGYFFSDWPGQCFPPGALGQPVICADLCSVVILFHSHVRDEVIPYLQDEVFTNIRVPYWVEQQMKLDLLETVRPLIIQELEPTWGAIFLDQTYDSAVGDQGDWRCNAAILFCHASFPSSGLSPQFCMIYYVATIFQVNSDSKVIRDHMRRDAFADAAILAETETPSTDSGLSDTLQKYGSIEFGNSFRFEYNSAPPDSLAAQDVQSAYVKSNVQLIYLPMEHPTDVYISSTIDQGLFSGLNVPIASIQRAALSDLTDDFTDILNRASYIPWETKSIDRIYTPADPSLNPIHQKGILLSWIRLQTNMYGVQIPVTFIFVQTMFYEELPVEQRATRKLFQTLCDKIRENLQKPPVADDDFVSLRDMLMEYTGIKFRANFGFAYKGDATNPSCKRTGDEVRGYTELMHAETPPISGRAVESWLDAEVFMKNSLTFPTFANNDIWYHIRDDIIGFGRSITGDEDWFDTSYTRVYLDPSGGTNIKHYAQYVYAVGELVLDGVKVSRIFVCYLGFFCGTTETY